MSCTCSAKHTARISSQQGTTEQHFHAKSAAGLTPSRSFLSRMSHMRSKRDSSAAGSAMFSVGLRLVSYLPQAGLAAASTVVRVFRVVVIPALAMLTVCCSITCRGTGQAPCCTHSASGKHQPRDADFAWLHHFVQPEFCGRPTGEYQMGPVLRSASCSPCPQHCLCSEPLRSRCLAEGGGGRALRVHQAGHAAPSACPAQPKEIWWRPGLAESQQ